MVIDAALLGACLAVAILIGLPAALAGRRRRLSRELSEVANALIDFAGAVRRAGQGLRVDETLLARARPLHSPEWISFEFVQSLAAPDPELLAESAQRLGDMAKAKAHAEKLVTLAEGVESTRPAVAAARQLLASR